VEPLREGDVGPDSHRFRCPACGGENPADAIFCGNPACRKALGEFRFIREEFLGAARWYERFADRIAGFIGRPTFLVVHALAIGAWVLANLGVAPVVAPFDEYPFGLLGILLSVEAIFITGVLLISQNRQNAYADQRGELDYEVNVRTYRRIGEVETLLRRSLGEP
jgi:uncharacterized membrane protein